MHRHVLPDPELQPSLLDIQPIAPVPAGPQPLTIDEQFAAFHRANPHVLASLRQLAHERIAAGRTRVGIKMLWELLRDRGCAVVGEHQYQLDNRLTSRYARQLIADEPLLAAYIETRSLRS